MKYDRPLALRQIKYADWQLLPIDNFSVMPLITVARQLGAIVRFCGATPEHYSVARHSLVVASLLPPVRELQLLALLHDVHECWTNDVPRPVVERIGPELRQYQAELDARLFALAGISPTEVDRAEVRDADDFACEIEIACLGRSERCVRECLPAYPDAAALLLACGNKSIDAMLWRTAVIEVMQSKEKARVPDLRVGERCGEVGI